MVLIPLTSLILLNWRIHLAIKHQQAFRASLQVNYMTILSNNEENIIRHVMESHSILVTKHGDIHLATANAT